MKLQLRLYAKLIDSRFGAWGFAFWLRPHKSTPHAGFKVQRLLPMDTGRVVVVLVLVLDSVLFNLVTISASFQFKSDQNYEKNAYHRIFC